MKLLKKIFNTIDIKQCNKNYSKKLLQLREYSKTCPIKVVFLVRENQKWTYQSLYELLDKDEKFEPIVLVSLLLLSHKGKDKTRLNLEDNYNFFKERNMNVEYTYRAGKYIDLKKFNPDIVFYDQPWDLPKIHQPKVVSEFALTCYNSYGISLLNLKSDYTQFFHKLLFKYYVDCELNLKRYEHYKKNNSKNCVIAGYPKLDGYLNINSLNIWKEENKFKIIYAPHHSIDEKGLRLSTFKENGQLILELAKKNPQTSWVFRPHPRFKHRLLRNHIMTEIEVENYYNEWLQVGTIFEEGDYLGLFNTSDMMITDCSSFLMEYLPANKPLIHIANKNSMAFNKLGEKVETLLYQVFTNNELAKQFDELVNRKNDIKKSERESFIKETFSFNAGEKIYKDIEMLIGGNND